MENILKIEKINCKNNRVSIEFSKTGKWERFLNGNEFFAEYSVNIEQIPKSVAIIPLLVNILPISWVFDLKIIVDDIDENFYKSITGVIDGYQKMYPKLTLKSNLEFANTISNNSKGAKKTAVLFSGGADAYCTLLRHIEEKPDIITIFGADISLSDYKGITIVNKLNREIADELSINYFNIGTNFRDMLNYHNLYKTLNASEMIGEWWHDFQHGIALLGLVSPLAYLNNYKIVYIASSFCVTQKGTYTCASDPTIDNFVKYGNTVVLHDGYELNRQEKIEFICKMRKKLKLDSIKLRVCWESAGGKNCCNCEKCYRTIMALLTEKEDPNNYNFDFDEKSRKKMIKYLKNNLKYDTMNGNKVNYLPIQEKFSKNYDISDTPSDLLWFRTIKIGSKNPEFYILKNRIKNKIKRILKITK